MIKIFYKMNYIQQSMSKKISNFIANLKINYFRSLFKITNNLYFLFTNNEKKKTISNLSSNSIYYSN